MKCFLPRGWQDEKDAGFRISKRFIDRYTGVDEGCKDLAISVENNMSMIDVHDIDRIKKRFQKESEKQPDESPGIICGETRQRQRHQAKGEGCSSI